MNPSTRTAGRFGQLLSGLSTRNLMFIAGALFLIDLAVFDPLPFIDEILLAGLTILLARYSSRRGGEEPAAEPGPFKPPAKDVTPH
ncbi:MAG: DUF6116 family protein [Acidobacteriota bacterium]